MNIGNKIPAMQNDEIKDKLSKYKLARKIFESNWEYLIQSLVEDSEYYKNANIQLLNLPERKLINIDQNTWELSPNNRAFNIELLKKHWMKLQINKKFKLKRMIKSYDLCYRVKFKIYFCIRGFCYTSIIIMFVFFNTKN